MKYVSCLAIVGLSMNVANCEDSKGLMFDTISTPHKTLVSKNFNLIEDSINAKRTLDDPRMSKGFEDRVVSTKRPEFVLQNSSRAFDTIADDLLVEHQNYENHPRKKIFGAIEAGFSFFENKHVRKVGSFLKKAVGIFIPIKTKSVLNLTESIFENKFGYRSSKLDKFMGRKMANVVVNRSLKGRNKDYLKRELTDAFRVCFKKSKTPLQASQWINQININLKKYNINYDKSLFDNAVLKAAQVQAMESQQGEDSSSLAREMKKHLKAVKDLNMLSVDQLKTRTGSWGNEAKNQYFK